eukprot:CAMPEP_0172467538 /NCGR_PEP_ID=MMETSP1065-20121228/59230_1 /TAXON_ID=265537 /ORGANISM="Amphiprora paludosa, Strain CCMP125" /LENGTH=129 /DNA_ID=CAMNT_0013224707 /DNA_START=6 /DNA_END=392 /DNA_ORIENTATION=+
MWLSPTPTKRQLEWLHMEASRMRGLQDFLNQKTLHLSNHAEAQAIRAFHDGLWTALELAQAWASGAPPKAPSLRAGGCAPGIGRKSDGAVAFDNRQAYLLDSLSFASVLPDKGNGNSMYDMIGAYSLFG